MILGYQNVMKFVELVLVKIDVWYRAKIQKIFGNEHKAEVFFIDYGNVKKRQYRFC